MRSAAFRAIHDIAVAAGSTLDHHAVGQMAADRIRGLLSVESASLRYWNHDLAVLDVLAFSSSRRGRTVPKLAKHNGIALRAFELGRPVVVNDYPGWEHARPNLVAEGIQASLSVPMIVRAQAVGVVSAHTYSPRHFSSDDVELLSLLAAQVGPALETARLLAESQRRQRETEALAELARRGASEGSINGVAGLVVQEACRLIDAAFAVLALVEDNRMRIVAAAGTRSQEWSKVQHVSPRGPMYQALGAGQTIIVERLRDEPLFTPEELPLLTAEDTHAILTTPLLRQQQPFGALLVAWRSEVRVAARQVGLAEALAGYAATIIDSARAHEELAASERELRRSEERYRAIIETTSEGVIGVDAQTRISYTNQQVCDMLGYTAQELLGQSLQDVVGEESHAELPRHLEQRQRGIKEQYDQHFRRKDGADVWTITAGSPIFDEHGRYAGSFGLLTDVTERRQTEERLRLLELAMENASEGVIVLQVATEPHAIVYVNTGFCRITGYSKDELLGQPASVLAGPNTDPELRPRLLAALAAGLPFYSEITAHRKDGSEYVQECRMEEVVDARRRRTHVVAIYRDVTSRRRAQEALAYQATHDALTDLPNRAALQDRLEQALLLAQRERLPLALLFIDLDKFKEVNDSHGHACGDLLLQAIGPRLRAVLRGSDTIARLGGDEFAIVLPPSGARLDAGRAAEKVLLALEQPFLIDGLSLTIGASIGVALYPDHGPDGAALMRAADTAMYEAKRRRGGYCLSQAAESSITETALASPSPT